MIVLPFFMSGIKSRVQFTVNISVWQQLRIGTATCIESNLRFRSILTFIPYLLVRVLLFVTSSKFLFRPLQSSLFDSVVCLNYLIIMFQVFTFVAQLLTLKLPNDNVLILFLVVASLWVGGVIGS